MQSKIDSRCSFKEMVPVKRLKPHPKNRNKHSAEQIDRLAEILQYQGWRHPIIVSNLSGSIVAGHGRLAAAKKLKLSSVPVDYQDFPDDDAEYAFLTSDNAIALWAELDLAGINADLGDLGPEFDLNMLGIKDFTLDPGENEGECDADEVPEASATAYVQLGDLFNLDRHRLLCGDSTDGSQVARLMNGEKADMVFTDPPYGINLDTDWGKRDGNAKIPDGRTVKRNSYKRIEGDAKPFDPAFILDTFDYCDEIFLFGANYFLKGTSDNSWVCWDKKLTESGDKNVIGDFELCWSKTKHKNTMLRIVWHGPFGHVKSLDGDNRVHPTQKPVKLCLEFLERWSEKEARIVDLFLGSGSTLIACEKTNRKCFGMEIDPIYCGVILDRWAKFTGKDPVREDGVAWSEIKTNAS